MRIALVEQSQGTRAAPIDALHEGEKGGNFESSLMDILESSAQLETEDLPDEEVATTDVQPELNAAQDVRVDGRLPLATERSGDASLQPVDADVDAEMEVEEMLGRLQGADPTFSPPVVDADAEGSPRAPGAGSGGPVPLQPDVVHSARPAESPGAVSKVAGAIDTSEPGNSVSQQTEPEPTRSASQQPATEPTRSASQQTEPERGRSVSQQPATEPTRSASQQTEAERGRSASQQPATEPARSASQQTEAERGRPASQQLATESARPASQQTEAERGDEQRPGDREGQQNVAAARELQDSGSQRVERLETRELSPGQTRVVSTAPETLQNPSDLRQAAAAAPKNDAEQRSGSRDERAETASREAASAQGSSRRAGAAEELPLESQDARNRTPQSQPIEGRTDPVHVNLATHVNAAPIAPPVEAAEPSAPASSARPMPPEAIPQHVEWLVARGGGTAEIQLHPPELGRLSIQVRVRGNDVQVVMTVQESAAQSVVAEYRHTLESGLSAKELKLDQFEIRDWADRDGSDARENQADRDRAGSDGREQPRDREGQTRPRGVAGALTHPGRGNESIPGDEGINLHV